VSMRAWSIVSLGVCLMPLGIWRVSLARRRREAAVEEPVPQPLAAPVAPILVAPTRAPEPDPANLPRLRPLPAPTPFRAALELREKHHEMVRFSRRAPVAPVPDPVPPLPRHVELEPVALEPVRERRLGRRKAHTVVHFEHKQQAANEA
jgi:hypothetical protein